MKLAIMQPYIFPYIGYFQLINAADKFVFYDDVTFIKQGWINRNNILLNGKKYLFTIPVKNISSFAAINETYVSDKPFSWGKKLLSTFTQAYNKAPFFNEVFPLIEKVMSGSSNQSISSVAKDSIISVMQYLNMQTEIVESSSIYNNSELKSEERIIDICQKENADTYINAPGGMALYQAKHFEVIKTILSFLEVVLERYHQFENEFVPGLSIIDVLMFNSVEEVRSMLANCRIDSKTASVPLSEGV